MRMILIGVLAAGMLGCGKAEKSSEQSAQKSESQQQNKGRTPGGGLAGAFLPIDEGSVGAQTQTPSNPAPAPAPQKNQTIPNVEGRLVEWPKAKQQMPGLVIVENKVQGSDPISVAASAYVSLSSRAESLNFQHQLNIMKEINEGRPVSFQQFQDLARQLKIQFQNQPAYRYYGYDTTTGGIVVLEDKVEKKRIYEEKGIPWDE